MHNDLLMEDRNHIVEEKLRLTARDHALKSSESMRSVVVAELENMKRLYNALVAKGSGSNPSTPVRGFASSLRADHEGLSKELRRIMKRACEGLDVMEGAAEPAEVKEEDAIDLAAAMQSLSAHSTPQPPSPPKGRVRTCASSTGNKGLIIKKPRVD